MLTISAMPEASPLNGALEEYSFGISPDMPFNCNF